MFGKHFLPICGLFLYFLNSVITIGEVLNFGKITLPDFPLMVYIFLCSKNSLSNLRSLRFFLCFLQFYIFRFFVLRWFLSLTSRALGLRLIFFFFLARGCLIVPALFVEKAIFSAMIYLDTTVPIAWVYFWTPLMYISILMLIPHCLDYCSFMVRLEMRWHEFSNFPLLFQNCFY